MIRTAPVTAVAPDPIRAMERLEAQLRRAADDLHEALTAIHEAEAEAFRAVHESKVRTLENPGPMLPDGSRCGHWMPRTGAACARFKGHHDSHRSRELMDEEAARRAGRRA